MDRTEVCLTSSGPPFDAVFLVFPSWLCRPRKAKKAWFASLPRGSSPCETTLGKSRTSHVSAEWTTRRLGWWDKKSKPHAAAGLLVI